MTRRTIVTGAITALATLTLALSGCSSSQKEADTVTPASSSSSAPTVTGSIVVFAAASLKDTFATIGRDFEAAHPGVTVKFSLGGSSDLATSINAGAPADVFAAASTKTMQTVVDAGNASAVPRNFAKNDMEIATAPGNPKHIGGLSDLTNSNLKVAICAPKVPCGDAATALFTQAKVDVKPVTLEPDVKSTLAKVTSGDVDAGIVYVTDVKAAGATVTGVTIPNAQNYVTTYPIAPLKQSTNAAAAAAFVDYVLSPAGLAVLKAAGFMSA